MRLDDDDLSFPDNVVAAEGARVLVILDENLSFPDSELLVGGIEIVSILWISVQVSGTPVDSGVGVFSLGDVPE